MKSLLYQALCLSIVSCFLFGISLSALISQPLPPNQPEQDCINALPICQTVQLQSNSYTGEGLNPNEINGVPSCLGGGEVNGLWYTLTTQTAGILGFSISPLNLADDYDWAVYDLTNSSCVNIFADPNLEVSCNWSGIAGVTGPNGLPGAQNEPPLIVAAGETYVIYVSNWSGTGTGFNLDFSGSTASFFDTTTTSMDSAFVECSSPDIQVSFSGDILCSSVDVSDFAVAGPGGPYTVTSANSLSCALGGTFDNSFQLSTSPQISLPGIYTISLIDTLLAFCGGITLSDSLNIFLDPTDSSGNFTVIPTITLPNCDGIGGGIEVQVSGGTGPYNLSWNTGSQDSILSGIPPGSYIITVSDTNFCSRQEVFELGLPDSCELSVSGTAFYDWNGNCIQDNNEFGIPYLYIDIALGTATFTDVVGNYEVLLDTGQVSIEAIPAQGTYLNAICPPTGQYVLNLPDNFADTSGLDFAMSIPEVQDLRVVGSSLSGFNPGFSFVYLLQAYNDGSVPVDATLTWEHDSLMTYDSSSVSPTMYDSLNRLLTWQLDTLYPGQTSFLAVYGTTDTTAGIGTSLIPIATVLPIMGDSTPSNNVFVDSSITIGSFDPNDKQVMPQGIGELGLIQATEDRMVYTIRFQNTGNAPAQFVIIRDTIDPKLDIREYQPVIQSHPYALTTEEDSILIFTFSDINLPDSVSDPIGSQGMVSFSLRHAGLLSVGDQFSNSAAIYFDFNDPILTNDVLNTIYAPMALDFLSDELLCMGDSITGVLTEAGLAPFTYQWSTGTQSANSAETMSPTVVDTSGYYTLTVTDALGISISDSVFLEITLMPIAHVNTDIQGLQVQFMDSSIHADTWLWDFGDGGTSTDPSPTHTYTDGGGYMAQLIVSNACGMDTFLLSLPLTNSTDDLFEQSVRVQPNPFSSQTLIRFDNPSANPYRLLLLDLQGKELRRVEDIRSEEVMVNRAGLSAGIYLFRLSGGGGIYTGKLMVEE